jgi:N-carbamoylputrescine amidase
MTGPTRRTALAASAASLIAAPTQARPRRLRVAIVQMASANHDIAGNLARAEAYAGQAVRRGARLVLFPEMMPSGYSLWYDVWDAAEPSDGPSSRWLAATSKRLGAWIGTSFLEASGDDFFNTFVLTGPDGAEAGRIRKQVPADAEAYFFKGEIGSHVIETAIGRIGVGICAENYYCFLANQMSERQVDFVLMPHSAPDSSASGGLPAAPGTHLALWYARRLGVPVAFVNKVGAWTTRTLNPPPVETHGFFPGRSCIVGGDAAVLVEMDGKPGVGVADLTLDPARKAPPGVVCSGVGIAELAIGGAAGAAAVTRTQAAGAAAYLANDERARRARAISGGPRQGAAQ